MRNHYPIELKLEVVSNYEAVTCGYKRLARMYNLKRDTVRSWVLNEKLQEALELNAKEYSKDDDEYEDSEDDDFSYC